ncbi:MAG TPA: DUF3310 domain-containing protein [Methanomicrobiales archaeon]|nr:DUF3310 domain-containing protein [Methanomicrobiales archaeon]
MMSEDRVNHPTHYQLYYGLEVIDLTEQMNFNRGNAVKYICRAGFKSTDTEIQDLQKAAFYIKREISRLEELRRLADITKFERLVDEQEECDICVQHGVKINTEFLES